MYDIMAIFFVSLCHTKMTTISFRYRQRGQDSELPKTLNCLQILVELDKMFGIYMGKRAYYFEGWLISSAILGKRGDLTQGPFALQL